MATITVENGDAMAVNGETTMREWFNQPDKNGVLETLRYANNHSANTRGEKTLGHFANDVIPAYEEYIDEKGVKAQFTGAPGDGNFMDFYIMEFDGGKRISKASGEIFDKAKEYMENTAGMKIPAEKDKADPFYKNCEAYAMLMVERGYVGIFAEKVAIENVARKLKKDFEFSTKQQDASGIDGFIGGVPVQVKPEGHAFSQHGDVSLIEYKMTVGKKLKVTFDRQELEQ